jgi:putative oxidoreductase
MTVFLLRVVAGLLFFQVGGMKLFGWFGGMPGGTTAPLLSQVWIGGVLEVAGGLAMILGLFTRPIAFVLSGEMAVAYFQFHQPKGLFPIQNHGEPAVLLCFIFLFFAAHGAGAWSMDGAWRRKGDGRSGTR